MGGWTRGERKDDGGGGGGGAVGSLQQWAPGEQGVVWAQPGTGTRTKQHLEG